MLANLAKIDEQMIRANQLNVRRHTIVGEFVKIASLASLIYSQIWLQV